jgi:glutamine synthetase
MHNPYLMGSALLAAFDDGLDNKIDPGPPENTNMYEAVAAGKVVKKLPMSLGEALDRLDEDETIKGSMPDEMYRVFKHYKRDEWERFLGATTQWDIDTYMDCLP